MPVDTPGQLYRSAVSQYSGRLTLIVSSVRATSSGLRSGVRMPEKAGPRIPQFQVSR